MQSVPVVPSHRQPEMGNIRWLSGMMCGSDTQPMEANSAKSSDDHPPSIEGT
jgi:hypothetical protein